VHFHGLLLFLTVATVLEHSSVVTIDHVRTVTAANTGGRVHLLRLVNLVLVDGEQFVVNKIARPEQVVVAAGQLA
jgi:hypothetical protein